MSVTVTLGDEVLTRDPVQQNGWDITGARTVTLFGAACAAAAASTENFHVRACP
jgi:hypothetical protein